MNKQIMNIGNWGDHQMDVDEILTKITKLENWVNEINLQIEGLKDSIKPYEGSEILTKPVIVSPEIFNYHNAKSGDTIIGSRGSIIQLD